MINRCSFESLFGQWFQLSGAAVVDDMVLHDEARDYAARALLDSLAFQHLEPELPAVTTEEVAAFCAAMAFELDYLPEQFAQFLASVDLTLDQAYAAIERHLRLTRYLDSIVADVQSEPSYQEALLRQAFLDLTLRPRAIRGGGIEKLAAMASAAAPSAGSVAAAREHFVVEHRRGDWGTLRRELASRSGISPDRLDRLVEGYARAYEALGARCGESRK
jgi:hypothetical protein